MLRCLFLAALLFQGNPPGAGHWEGTVTMGGREMKLAVDLTRSAQGQWIGNADLLDLDAIDVPLPKIVVKGASIVFAMSHEAADPHFEGELSPDGKSITGKLRQDGGTYPFHLRWVAAPNVKLPEKSSPISKDAAGAWEGAIATSDGKNLRVRIELENGRDGLGSGAFSSPDQDAQNLPLTGIVQKGTSLRFAVKLAGLTFEGELKGEELSGMVKQGAVSKPLTLKRVGR